MQVRSILSALLLAQLTSVAGGQCESVPTVPLPPITGTPYPVAPGTPYPFSPGGPMSPGPGLILQYSDLLALDSTSWTVWWQANREPWLQVRTRVHSGGAVTGGEDFFLGHGERADESLPGRPRLAEVRELALPALERLLEQEGNPAAIEAALVAIGRAGGALLGAERERLARVLVDYLPHPNSAVSRAAILSLGLLGSEMEAMRLSEIALRTRTGAQLLGETQVDDQRAAWGALGLGMLGRRAMREDVRRFAVHRLASVLAEEHRNPELPAACIVALGFLPLELPRTQAHLVTALSRGEGTVSTSRTGTLHFLLEYLAEDDHPALARAHVPGAIARLYADLPEPMRDAVEGQIVDGLLDTLSRRERDEVARGAVQALGEMVGSGEGDSERRARAALLDAARRHGDQLTRYLARVSLGRIAARPGRGDQPLAGSDELRRFLLNDLARGSSQERHWSGLGLGVLARAMADDGRTARAQSVADSLRDALRDARSPQEVGALGTALGLAGGFGAGQALLDQLGDTLDDGLRAQLAIALGLSGESRVVSGLRALSEEARFRPTLAEELAVARAMLGDPSLTGELSTELADTGSLDRRAAVARALGRGGDRSAIAPLVSVLRDDTNSGLERAWAAAALGRVIEPEPLAWDHEIARGLNYSANTQSLRSVLSAGTPASY